ncbi:hypothetical protein ACFWQC_01210 [Nocardioides sp. NPDC058538]|uniref:hypothetical protein n=1 Tax=Nocardioides sp. NPDC058538 TaxID=3346542 RepID=UPI00366939D6
MRAVVGDVEGVDGDGGAVQLSDQAGLVVDRAFAQVTAGPRAAISIQTAGWRPSSSRRRARRSRPVAARVLKNAIDTLREPYTSDVVSFDVEPPLQHVGTWVIAHDQVSVPLDILSGKGVVDLEQ